MMGPTLKTRYISSLAIKHCEDQIKKDWSELEKKAFPKFKEYAKNEVIKKFGKRQADMLSAQFYGYTAHWIVSYCVANYGWR